MRGVGLLVAGGGEGPVYLGEVHVVLCGGEVGGAVGESGCPVYLGEVGGVLVAGGDEGPGAGPAH